MKRKITLFIAASVLLAMNAFSQGNKMPVTELRSSLAYHHIQIAGEMNVNLIQDEVHGVIVQGTTYQVGNLVTLLKNDTLFVYQTNTRKSDSRTFVTIHVNALVSLGVSGQTKVDCTGLVNADYLIIRASEGAQIKLDVRALKVDSKAVGCSFINLAGSTGSNTESHDGCGIIDSRQLDVIEIKSPSSETCYGC